MMTPVFPELEAAVRRAGILVNNDELVRSLQSYLESGEGGFNCIPSVIDELIDEQAWVERMDMAGRRYNFAPDEFEKFITSPFPAGLETTKDAIRKYLGDSSNPVRVKFERLLDVKKGGGPGNLDGPRDATGRFSPSPADRESTQAVPATPSKPRETITGNTVGYAVRRLERAAKENQAVAAIFERLERGEISANAAMVEAGFRPRTISIPDDPEGAGRRLGRHFTPEQFERMVAVARAELGSTAGMTTSAKG